MSSMTERSLHFVSRRIARTSVLAACCAVLALNSCSRSKDEGVAAGPTKLKVCYIGLTCEPPIFVAYEKGFFKEEGLDVELVKTDWDTMRDGLGLGRFQANHTLIMYVLKPIEEGLDVKLTGGLHSGCLRLQAGIKTDIKRVEDLKGKRIGISHMGAPPFLFASRILANHGLDPKNDVEWVTFPSDAVELALDRGQVDAVASAEPIGTLLLAHEKVHKLIDQALDMPYANEFCCVTVVNGKFARENPKAAAALTRALLKAGKWVAANKTAAAKLAVEKGYLASTPELNAQAIKDVGYKPGVANAKRDVLQVAKEMKTAGFLNPKTDPEELTKRAWLDLEGVTDGWIESTEVEKVAGGGDPPDLNQPELAALVDRSEICDCYGGTDEMESSIHLTGIWANVAPRFWEPIRPEGYVSLFAAQTKQKKEITFCTGQGVTKVVVDESR
jgi:NitT/TauT family transport system substrate-binding protein